MKELETPTMWTISEAAVQTNIKVCFIRRLVREEKIKYIKAGKKYLINAQSLILYLNGNEEE